MRQLRSAPCSAESLVDALNDLAWELRNRNSSESLRLAQEAYDRARAETGGSIDRVARSLGIRSVVKSLTTSDHEGAIRDARRALSLGRDRLDPNLVVQTLGSIALALWNQNQFAQAERAYREVIERSDHAGYKTYQIAARHDLASLLGDAVGHQRAYPGLFRSYLEAKELGSASIQAAALCNIAHHLHEEGHTPIAATIAAHAVDISREHQLEMLESTAGRVLGDIYLTLGHPQMALQLGRQAGTLSEQAAPSLISVRASLLEARSLRAIGELEKALACASVALDACADWEISQERIDLLKLASELRAVNGKTPVSEEFRKRSRTAEMDLASAKSRVQEFGDSDGQRPSERTRQILTLCAWCGVPLACEASRLPPGTMASVISHGICGECAERTFSEFALNTDL